MQSRLPDLGQGKLCGQQSALGVQLLQIGDVAGLVSFAGVVQGRDRGGALSGGGGLLLGQTPGPFERAFDLAKGRDDGLAVGKGGLVAARGSRVGLSAQAAAIEDRRQDAGSNAPYGRGI